MIDIPLLTGIAGACCILIGFLLVQTHRWTQDRLAYDVLNLIGSMLLLIYGLFGRAWPFVALNAVWAIYSAKDILLDLKRIKQVRKSG